MKKFDILEYEAFWRTVHKKSENDLAAVCFPDKPLYFNLFFDRIQKNALNRYFKEEQVFLEKQRLLDIGCGRGRWLEFYKDQHNAEVYGIDLSAEAVEICQKKYTNAVQGSITEMPFADNSFDFVNSVTVLLHLPYEVKHQAIREIHRVLKPGGRAILIETTQANDPSPHVYGLSCNEWENLFANNKMSLIHQSGHCFNIFRRCLPGRMPFRDRIAIYLDYPVEYGLMKGFYGKQCDFSLQHLMVFKK